MNRFAPLLLLLAAAPAAAVEPVYIGDSILVELHENPLHVAPDALPASEAAALSFLVSNPTTNTGAHRFRVDGHAAAIQDALQPGTATYVNFTAAAPGEYAYYCTIPGHKEGGMVGTLIVADTGRGGSGVKQDDVPAPPLLAAAGAALAAALLWGRRR